MFGIVEHQSFWLDLKILVKLQRVFSRKGVNKDDASFYGKFRGSIVELSNSDVEKINVDAKGSSLCGAM